MLNNYWLADSQFIAGDQISFADLQCYHEFVSHIAGGIIPADIWDKNPRVKQFCDAMGEREHSKTVSAMIMKIGEMVKAGQGIEMKRKTSLAKGTEITGGHYTGIPYLQA